MKKKTIKLAFKNHKSFIKPVPDPTCFHGNDTFSERRRNDFYRHGNSVRSNSVRTNEIRTNEVLTEISI